MALQYRKDDYFDHGRERDEPHIDPEELCGQAPHRNNIDGSRFHSSDIVPTDQIRDNDPGSNETSQFRFGK